jgi:hypothetical protein
MVEWFFKCCLRDYVNGNWREGFVAHGWFSVFNLRFRPLCIGLLIK